MEQRCYDCEFYMQFHNVGGKGSCHKNSPGVSTQDSSAHWPTVDMKDWCGEFKTRGHPPE